VGEPAGLTTRTLPRSVQILVAGGGPVGLACAVELGRRGIGCLVVEPRATVSHARPRCKTINVRSMPTGRLATGYTVTGVEQGEAGVRVTVIGAAYAGGTALRPNFGLVFTAPDLWRHVRHGPAVHYWIINSEAPALMGPLDLDGTWWFIAFGVDQETGEQEAARLIDAAAGMASGASSWPGTRPT
jgi:FAD binding domain-containing protein